MKFSRPFIFGSWLMGLESKPKTYRVVGAGVPRLGEPARPALTNPTTPELFSSSGVAGPTSVPQVPASARTATAGFWKRLCQLITKRVTVMSRRSHPSLAAIQTELRLDAVRPLRSRLIDDDLQVVRDPAPDRG